MLVLSRKPQESIQIGDNIEIIVSSIQGNRVRLGIRAPETVSVHRSEIIRDERKGRSPRPLTTSAPLATPCQMSRPM